MKNMFKKVIALLLTVSVFFTANGVVAYGVDEVSGGSVVTHADVRSLLTDIEASIKQDGEAVGEGSKISSENPIDVAVSFRAPLLGDGGAAGTYVEKGDTATIVLSKGFKLTGGEVAIEWLDKDTGIKIGTLTIDNAGDREVVADISFDGADEVFDGTDAGNGVWSEALCSFNVELMYDNSGGNDTEGDKPVTILDKNYTVVVPPVPTITTVEKTGSRNGQFINWMVKVDATKGITPGDISGYKFSDNIEAVGTYVVGSFKVGITSVEADAIGLADDFPEEIRTLEYFFPENTVGENYIFFTTKILDDVFFANGNKSVENTAEIYNGAKKECFSTAIIPFEGDWIKKNEVAINHATGVISWAITANQLGETLPNAIIHDSLDDKLEWQEATLKVKKTETSGWEDSGIYFSAEPDEGNYELGVINHPVLLTITAKIKKDIDIYHTVQEVSNTATLTWENSVSGGIDSEEIKSNIGLNPIKKDGLSFHIPTHTAEWKVSVEKSDVMVDLRIVELLVYGDTFDIDGEYELEGTSTGGLTEFIAEDIKLLKPSYNQKNVVNSWAAEGISDLALTEYKVKDKEGNIVADLLVVTKSDGSGIDVSTSTQSFTFKSIVTNPQIYLSNEEKNSIVNQAVLLSDNVEINKASAKLEFTSRILNKDTITFEDAKKDLTLVSNVNKTASSIDRNFNYNDKSVVFRLHVNASGIVDTVGGLTTVDGKFLGDVTVSDTLPAGWSFTAFPSGNRFLIYEGIENQKKVTATGVPADTTIVTPDFSEAGKATFTFSALDKPYVILLRAVPSDETLKGYFSVNGELSVENEATLDVENGEIDVTSKERVKLKAQVISKNVAIKEAGVLNWVVDYNAYGLEYPSTIIKDTIPFGLDLRTDSKGVLDITNGHIRINQLLLKEDGTTEEGRDITDVSPFVSYNASTRVLEFIVPELTKGYRFQYITDVTGNPDANLSNKVEFAGGHSGESEVVKAYKVKEADASATMRRSGWVEITKKNESGISLPGAEFTIFTDDDNPVVFKEGITLVNGVVTLRGLPEGNYILKETKAPEGYLLSNAVHKVVVVNNGGRITTTINDKGTNRMEIVNLKEGTVGNISISKTVKGNAGNTQKLFDFKIWVDGVTGDYPFTKGATDSGVVSFVDGNATFQLRDGEHILIENLPQNTDYIVEEIDYTVDGYVTTKVNDVGTVLADDTQVVVFVNTKNIVVDGGEGSSGQAGRGRSGSAIGNIPVPATIIGKKTIDGKTPTGSEYSFSLKDSTSRVLQTTTNSGQTVAFQSLSFNRVGTYIYTISENKGNDTNIEYDSTVYTIVVDVTKGTGLILDISYLKNGVAYNGELVFNNKTIDASLGKKGNNNTVAPTVPPSGGINGGAGVATGGTSTSAGTGGSAGVEQGNGTDVSNGYNNIHNGASGGAPQTGDRNFPWFWLLCMLVSAGGIVLLMRNNEN